MRISCLMPTYGRTGGSLRLLAEAVEAFRQQTYADRELIIHNDTPGVEYVCHVPGVVVVNHHERMPTLSDKIQAMVDMASGDYMCRWDDDDISLPHRLEYSFLRLMRAGTLEWRPINYWYCPEGHQWEHVSRPGNTHIMALWHRALLDQLPGGTYPAKMSGWEDQAFNQLADATGHTKPVEVPVEDVTYLYRWGVSNRHLSGHGGGPERMQRHYDEIGQAHHEPGRYVIEPGWRADYVQLARNAAIRHAKAHGAR